MHVRAAASSPFAASRASAAALCQSPARPHSLGGFRACRAPWPTLLTRTHKIAAIEAWAAAARERLMPAADLAECLLPRALEVLQDNREDGKEVSWWAR
jgi:hypothetical protein